MDHHHKRHRDDSHNESRKSHKSHHRKHSRKHSPPSDEEQDERQRHHKKHRHHRDRSAEYDPHLRIKQEKDEENFDRQERERSRHDDRRREHRRERDRHGGDHGLNTASARVKEEKDNKEEKAEDKVQPNFDLSGKLTEDTNTFRGVVIKYNEPPEAMIPKRKWRLYPFKGSESLPVLHIHRQSAFLLGRDRKIADIPVDHPSCSKQHAVLQFRAVPYERADGTQGRRVRPYIIDLESANGTFLNAEKMEPRKYYELKEKDVIKFGFSSREYVVLHDSVDTSEIGGNDYEDV